jgi:hypothetical protein
LNTRNLLKAKTLSSAKFVIKLSKIWVWDPGSGKPYPESRAIKAPDPESRVKKAKDPGSRVRKTPDPGSGFATLHKITG